MKSYEESKNEVLEKIDELVEQTKDTSIDQTLELWYKFTEHDFFKYKHLCDWRLIFSYLEDEEEERIHDLDLYKKEYIQNSRSEPEEERIGDLESIFIGSTCLFDYFIFVTKDLSDGVAIEHHDYIYTEEDVHEVIKQRQARMNLSLKKLISVLKERDKTWNEYS